MIGQISEENTLSSRINENPKEINEKWKLKILNFEDEISAW
jgi:hypothetical protein